MPHLLLDLETPIGMEEMNRTLLKCPNNHSHDGGLYQLKYLTGDRDNVPVCITIYQCSLCMKRWLGVAYNKPQEKR